MPLQVLTAGEEVRLRPRSGGADGVPTVSAHLEAPGLEPALREKIAQEVARIVTDGMRRAPPQGTAPMTAPPVRVTVSFDGVPHGSELPVQVRSAADERVASLLGAHGGAAGAGHRPSYVAVPPGNMQSLAEIDPLPMPAPGNSNIVIAFYMKNSWGVIEDTFQLLVSDLGQGLRTGEQNPPLVFPHGPGLLPPDPGPDPGPGPNPLPPPAPPPPPAAMTVGLRLGGSVTWSKRVWSWSASAGMMQEVQVDYQYPQWYCMNLTNDVTSPYYADTIVFEKPKFLGVWTPMYNLEIARFWKLFTGKRLLFTWLADS